MDISQDQFCVEIYRGNAVRDGRGHDTTSNEHRALTLTVRTPSVATLFGEQLGLAEGRPPRQIASIAIATTKSIYLGIISQFHNC